MSNHDRDKKCPVTYLTTDFGAPVPDNQNSLTAGPRGPLLAQDVWLHEKLGNFVREVIPERRMHAKGSGAFGTFTVTHDITRYTRAKLFSQIGKKTEMFARFTTVAGERGAADAERDVRGFALKFYTQEGNFDIVGNNTPVFFVRDPMKFPDFIHSQKRTPDSGLRDNTMQWDFWTLSPESAHQVSYLMGDRGLPKTWRHMNGYSSHTYMWVNEAGEKFWVKYHFLTEQGLEFLTNEEADEIAGTDADYHRRDLFESIKNGDFPSWRLEVQIMPYEDAKTYRFNPFDLTKIWSKKDYPRIPVGRFTLNQNPVNHYAQIEQAAFSPSNLVPGTGVSPDKMLLGRVFSYPDAQRNRLGTNFNQLPVNRPVIATNSYDKEGAMNFFHSGDAPVYAPNSFGRSYQDEQGPVDNGWEADGTLVRAAYSLHSEDDDFVPARALVAEVVEAIDAGDAAGVQHSLPAKPADQKIGGKNQDGEREPSQEEASKRNEGHDVPCPRRYGGRPDGPGQRAGPISRASPGPFPRVA